MKYRTLLLKQDTRKKEVSFSYLASESPGVPVDKGAEEDRSSHRSSYGSYVGLAERQKGQVMESKFGFRTLADDDASLGDQKMQLEPLVLVLNHLMLEIVEDYVHARSITGDKFWSDFRDISRPGGPLLLHRWGSTALRIDLVNLPGTSIFGFHIWEEYPSQDNFHGVVAALSSFLKPLGWMDANLFTIPSNRKISEQVSVQYAFTKASPPPGPRFTRP